MLKKLRRQRYEICQMRSESNSNENPNANPNEIFFLLNFTRTLRACHEIRVSTTLLSSSNLPKKKYCLIFLERERKQFFFLLSKFVEWETQNLFLFFILIFKNIFFIDFPQRKQRERKRLPLNSAEILVVVPPCYLVHLLPIRFC